MNPEQRVVIVGGGYGGLQVALGLANKKVSITLIDKNNYHELLPELPYRLNKKDVQTRVPFAELLNKNNLIFKQEQVTQVNYQTKELYLASGDKVGFDYLILALGSQTNYFNIPGLEEHALGFINTEQVDRFNQQLAENFRKASKLSTDLIKVKDLMSVIIGGGGLTGIEVTAELISKLPKMAEQYNLDPSLFKIYLVEAQNTLLPAGGDSVLSEKITNFFAEQSQVELVLNSAIQGCEPGKVYLADNRTLQAQNILWTGGIRGNTFFEQPFINQNGQEEKWPLGRGFRVLVDDLYRLKTPEAPQTYAIGDNALVLDLETGNPLPLNGQAAEKQGKSLVQHIIAELEGTIPKPRAISLDGILVSLGSDVGVGRLWKPFCCPLPLGKLARWLKLFVELRYRKLDIRK